MDYLHRMSMSQLFCTELWEEEIVFKYFGSCKLPT